MMNYNIKNFHEEIIDMLQEIKFALNERDEPLSETERELIREIQTDLYEVYAKYNRFLLEVLRPQ